MNIYYKENSIGIYDIKWADDLFILQQSSMFIVLIICITNLLPVCYQ